MKTLNEITNGYQSIFDGMSIMTVASRLDAAACCGNEAEAANSKEFYDCVHCILCSYVVSGSLTAVEIPCDVSILHWVNAMNYVINWFNDYNVPDDDFDPDDDTETAEDMMYPDCSSHFITKDMEAEYDTNLEQLKACIGDYVPCPYSTAYLDMVTGGDYELDDDLYEDGSSYFTTKDMEAEYDPTDDDDPDDDYDPSIFCTKATEDVVDTETTEDMMYPDCSSHFTTKDMEAEYDPDDDRIDVSCKDCPDDECTGHCMSCYYR